MLGSRPDEMMDTMVNPLFVDNVLFVILGTAVQNKIHVTWRYSSVVVVPDDIKLPVNFQESMVCRKL
jgi:hypothetical protein